MAVNLFTGEEDYYVPPAPVAAPANLASLQRAGIDPGYADLGLSAEEASAVQRAEEAANYGQTRRAWNQGLAQLSSTPDAVRGLYRNITGPEGSGDRYLRRAQQTTEQAAEYAPDVQDLSDINGVGDAFAYARNALVSNAPTMLPTIAAAAATGGTAGVVLGGARVGAQQVVKKGVANAVGRALTPMRAAALGAYGPSVALQANQMVDPALDRTAGGTARERALKASAGAFGTAAIEVLPTVKLLERFGLGDQVKDAVSRSMASRVGRAALGQAGLEGSTEAIQTFGEKATHKWINDNVETLSADALGDYLNAFVAGGITGGALGAPSGIRDPNAIKTKVKEIERVRLGRGQKQPADMVDETVPAAKEAAPADVFGQAAATVDSTVKAPADTVGTPPVAPAAPPVAAPAAGKAMGPSEDVVDVKSTFTKIMNDLDVDDAFEGKFSSAWDKSNEFFRTVNTPAFDRNGSVVLNDRGAPVYDKTEIGIDAGGVTRGGVSSNQLFRIDDAKARQEASRAEGRLGMTAPQALAASILDNDQLSGLSPDAIKAAGLYLTTGDYKGSAAGRELDAYLDRLPDDQRIQFLYVGQVFADKVAEAREAGITEPMTIDSLTASRDPKALPENAAQVDDIAALDERDLPETDKYGREIQELSDLISNADMKNIGGDIGRYQDPRSGAIKPGYIPVTDKNGNLKAVSIRALRTMVSKVPSLAQSFNGPDGDVNRVVTALSVLRQKGYKVDPESIQPGLVISSKKDSGGAKQMIRLSPIQAAAIREGLKGSAPPSIGRGTPGMPGKPTTGRLQLDVSEDRTPEGAIDRTPSTALRPGRVPQGLRVGPEGQLTEAESLDAESLEDTREQKRAAENLFYRAAGMLASAVKEGAFVPRGNIKNAIEAVENFFAAKPTLRTSALGKAYASALRNLEEFIPAQTERDTRTSRKAKPLAQAINVAVPQPAVKVRTKSRTERADEATADDTGRINPATPTGVERVGEPKTPITRKPRRFAKILKLPDDSKVGIKDAKPGQKDNLRTKVREDQSTEQLKNAVGKVKSERAEEALQLLLDGQIELSDGSTAVFSAAALKRGAALATRIADGWASYPDKGTFKEQSAWLDGRGKDVPMPAELHDFVTDLYRAGEAAMQYGKPAPMTAKEANGKAFKPGELKDWTDGRRVIDDETDMENLCLGTSRHVEWMLQAHGYESATAHGSVAVPGGKPGDTMDHYVAVAVIDGETFVVDQPQGELFSPLGDGNKVRVTDRTYTPRFIAQKDLAAAYATPGVKFSVAANIDTAKLPIADVEVTSKPKNQVREDQDVTDAANDPNSSSDTTRLKLMLKALSAKLGIAEVVDVVNRKGSFGAYDPKTRRIALNLAKRRGAARIDTLLHEYGHHIISETWKDLPVEAKRAVVKEYMAWRRAQRGNTTFEQTRASRAPAFIKKWLGDRQGATPYAKLTTDQRKQMLSVHEFMADQLAAALGANAETQGVVAQFFRRVADMMRAVYNAVSGGAYKPAPTVEAWVQTLINTESARVIHGEADIATQWKLLADAKAGVPVLPPALVPGQGRPGNGGDKPSSLFFALGQEDRGRLLRALRERDVYDQIYLQAPQGVKDRLDTYGDDMSILVDYGAALFAKGKLKLGASLRSPMRRLLDLVKLALGLPTDRALAEMILTDAKNGKVEGRNGKRYDALARAYRGYYDPADVDENGKPKFRKVSNVGRRVSEFNRSVKRVLGPMYDKLITDAGARMRDTNVPVLARIAASIEPRSGEKTADGGYLQGVDARWQKMMIPYFKATEKLSTKEKAVLNRALQRGRPPKNKKLAVAYTEMRTLMDNLYADAKKNGVTFPARKDFWPVIIDTKAVARDREGFKALLSNPAFEKDIREFFGTIVDKSDPRNPVTKADVDTPIGTLIDRMTLIAETADQSHVGEIDFTDGVKAPAFAHSRRRIMGFVQNLATDAERAKFAKFQQRDLDGTVVRYTRSLAKRMEFKSRFVGTEIDPVTKKEVTFSKLDLEPGSQLYNLAKRQGATDTDIQQARDLVNMAVGSYKAELNPAIKWAFSKWDALAGTNLADMPVEKWAAVQMGFMTYQNLRLLPLAAFSSFVDPLGVFTRGGAQAGSTFGAYKEALGAMKKSNPTQLRAMAEAMGIVESHALSDALAATYGGSFDPNGVAGKLNNALFKLNGLEAITRYSRLAALAMGHRFLREHGTQPTKHSVRLLQELGLKASDIKADPNNVNYVVMNDKVAKALYRFVEESVIRPKPTQRPNWHNDPNFMFASQYKGYLYSFWNTVPKRMMVELDAGNTTAALLPLLPYFAVTLAAEALRDMLQDDEYKKETWGPMDYATHAMVRTGVLGPRYGVFNDVKSDAEHGSTVLNSWIGPTGQQITQVAGALAGQRDLTNTAVEALPGSVIYEDWAR